MPALLGFKSARHVITAPTYVGAGTTGNGSGSNITLGLPVGIQQNDMLIIVATVIATGDPTCSGYTRLAVGGSNYSTTGYRSVMFWKRATASETNPTLIVSGSQYSTVARVYAFRGCSNTDPPYNVFSNSTNWYGSPNKPHFPFVNITVDKTFVFGAQAGAWANTNPSFSITNNAGLTNTITNQLFGNSHSSIASFALANIAGGVLASAGTLGEVVLNNGTTGNFGIDGQTLIVLAPAS